MFFCSQNINVEVLSVLSLEWDATNANSGLRPYHALSFRINGYADYTYENGTAHTETGNILFVPAYLEYNIKSQSEKLFVIHFQSESPLPKSIQNFFSTNPGYYEKLFREIYSAWYQRRVGYEYECKSIIYKILFSIERDVAKARITNCNDNIYEAVKYIHKHFLDQNISVNHLAHLSGMSDTYFRKLFVNNFYITPLKYINNLKVAYAKELLQSSYYTVKEVSDKLNFNNVSYFSLFIKKETGFPPSTFIH